MRRTRTGAWVLPKNHLKEFSSKEIDYNSLVLDCFPDYERKVLQRKMSLYNTSFNCSTKSVRLKDLQDKE